MRTILHKLLPLVNLTEVSTSDIAKYIEPYDIFDDDEYYDLIRKKEDQDGVIQLAGKKANKPIVFAFCNFPNEVFIEEGKSIKKTGTRSGIVIMSEHALSESCVLKFKVLKEGKPGNSCIGFGISEKAGLNYCPFNCSRNFGKFVTYYTYRNEGYLNLGEVGNKFIPKDYAQGFKPYDSVNLVIDLNQGEISFGINDVMFPEKSFLLGKFAQVHVAVWMSHQDDEVQLIYEY